MGEAGKEEEGQLRPYNAKMKHLRKKHLTLKYLLSLKGRLRNFLILDPKYHPRSAEGQHW